MGAQTPKHEVILSDPEVPCEIIKKGDGYLHIACRKCHEMCKLDLRRQSKSYPAGDAQDLFQIICPKCGLLQRMLAV